MVAGSGWGPVAEESTAAEALRALFRLKGLVRVRRCAAMVTVPAGAVRCPMLSAGKPQLTCLYCKYQARMTISAIKLRWLKHGGEAFKRWVPLCLELTALAAATKPNLRDLHVRRLLPSVLLRTAAALV